MFYSIRYYPKTLAQKNDAYSLWAKIRVQKKMDVLEKRRGDRKKLSWITLPLLTDLERNDELEWNLAYEKEYKQAFDLLKVYPKTSEEKTEAYEMWARDMKETAMYLLEKDFREQHHFTFRHNSSLVNFIKKMLTKSLIKYLNIIYLLI